MTDKTKVDVFRDRATGLLWAANPGTPAHARMTKGIERGEFERSTLTADKPKSKPPAAAPRRSRKTGDDTE